MKLENERYEVTFVEKGGEIYSFTDKQTGLQYMWPVSYTHLDVYKRQWFYSMDANNC